MPSGDRGVCIDQVLDGERDRISAQRKNREDESDLCVGLAISGGGIRSASFGLGVLQALDGSGAFKWLDYLSTVSGGGFIGSSLSWFNHLQKGKQWEFPFGVRGSGARSSKSGNPLDFIRQHGDYLTPGRNLSAMSLLAVVLRNMLMSFAVYFAMLAFLMFVAIDVDFIPKPPPPVGEGQSIDWARARGLAIDWAILVGVLFAVISALYALGTFAASIVGVRSYYRGYRVRVLVQKWLGWAVTLAIGLALIGSLPFTNTIIRGWLFAGAGAGSAALGAGGGIYEFIRQQGPKVISAAPSAVRIWVTALLLIYGFLMLGYYVAVELHEGWELLDVALWVLAPGLFFALFINTNYFGLGRMYRDRLMETFLPDPATVESGRWNLAKQADKAKLSDMGGADEHGPYQLINCNVVLVDSEVAKYRGRGGDNFILSPLFSGSDATSWYQTRQFLGNRMTLGTAMATSGAAANPNTGVSGRGPTRNRLVSFLMALLGVRLGYWARNPYANWFRRLVAAILPPNLLYPGIVQGLLGQRLNARAGFLELSDGGHFENTALYELARRKLDVIIVSDAGADPKFVMADLGNAVERVRVDFGYYIRFPFDEYDLRGVMPGSDGDDFFAEKYDLAQRGFAIGTIEYAPNEWGLIFYIKPTVTRNLPGDIYAYKKAHETFPNESTADQFFDEVQIEAYRELGYRLSKVMLHEKYMITRDAGTDRIRVRKPGKGEDGRTLSEYVLA